MDVVGLFILLLCCGLSARQYMHSVSNLLSHMWVYVWNPASDTITVSIVTEWVIWHQRREYIYKRWGIYNYMCKYMHGMGHSILQPWVYEWNWLFNITDVSTCRGWVIWYCEYMHGMSALILPTWSVPFIISDVIIFMEWAIREWRKHIALSNSWGNI